MAGLLGWFVCPVLARASFCYGLSCIFLCLEFCNALWAF